MPRGMLLEQKARSRLGSTSSWRSSNNERPHEALDVKCPAEVYQPSKRTYQGLPDIDYPFRDKAMFPSQCFTRSLAIARA
jgi:hypothetical protein